MSKPSGIYVQKTFTYNCMNIATCLEILEKIDEELSLEADLHVELKLNKLFFKVVGLEPNVQSTINKLREFLSTYALPKSDPRKGVRADVLAKYVRRTIPLDVLAIVIKKTLGVPAEVRNQNIYADIDLDTLMTIAKKVVEAQQKVESMSYSSSLKKLITATIAIYGIDVSEVLEILNSMQYINEKNELIIPWTQALEELGDMFEKQS